MKYLVAYDYDPENPNPHEWQADPTAFSTAEDAVRFAEREDEMLLTESGYEEDELHRWIVVAVRD